MLRQMKRTEMSPSEYSGDVSTRHTARGMFVFVYAQRLRGTESESIVPSPRQLSFDG